MQVLEGNVASYIESSMAFPAANHDRIYLVPREITLSAAFAAESEGICFGLRCAE